MKMSILQWTWRALLLGGAVLVGYYAFILIDATRFQQEQNRVLDRLRETEQPTPAAELSPSASQTSKPAPLAMNPRGLIGRIEIPRLGIATIVIEGSDAVALRRAAGHVPGTPLPGQIGNMAVTGHRDTFFRPLRNLERDDLIKVITPRAEYLYRVVSLSVVGPDDLRVLDSEARETLTLITCFPFNYIGAAPRRFIVRADRVRDPTPTRLTPETD
jgi:sortase A